MRLEMREPLTARYIYVNPETNQVHLLLPIVGGLEIGTDNTCQSAVALKAFFGKYASADKNKDDALHILTRYKQALEYDIAIIPESGRLKASKQSRLEQIKQYISTLKTIGSAREFDSLYLSDPKYPKSVETVIQSAGNLYGMVLRPGEGLDTHLRTVKPIFSLHRGKDEVFYNALKSTYSTLKIDPQTAPLTQFKQRISAALNHQTIKSQADFEKLQHELTTALHLDFQTTNEGIPITKDYIDNQMGNYDATIEEYIDSMTHYCTYGILDKLDASPFQHLTSQDKEKLSMLTQFLMGEVNIYCASNKISHENFGRILDKSPELSQLIASSIKEATEQRKPVEKILIEILNDHADKFKLSRALTPQDVSHMMAKFIKHYAIIQKIEDPDEFMIADPDKPGKFVTHQGSICTDFTEIIAAGFPTHKTPYFDTIQHDFSEYDYTISNSNEHVSSHVDIDAENLPLYLSHLLIAGHTDYAIEIIKDHMPLFQEMAPASLQLIFNSKNKEGENLLQYVAKKSSNDFIQIASLLSKEQLVTNFQERNNRGDTLIHAIAYKPQVLATALSVIPPNDRQLLLQEKNTRKETVFEAVRNEKSLQILHDISSTFVENTRKSVAPKPVIPPQPRMPLQPSKKTEIQASSRPPAPVAQATTSKTTPASEENKHPNIAQTKANNAYQLYLNHSLKEVQQLGAKNCFVWHSANDKQFSYISSTGDVTEINMNIAKRFTFKAQLQQFTHDTAHQSMDSVCVLHLDASEMARLTQKAGFPTHIVAPMPATSQTIDYKTKVHNLLEKDEDSSHPQKGQ
ncbi:MAG: hypothetical protein P1U61_01730 [Legionellaceae bacterium]|nr:hypothetical protein [Legionellaceae bacterium]